MDKINYDGRKFTTVENSKNGEVSAQTTFAYQQRGNILWAEYSGGEVVKGFLLGLVAEDDCLNFTYQHINRSGQQRAGQCESKPELLPDGRLRLHERWQWLTGDCSSGESVIEELPKT